MQLQLFPPEILALQEELCKHPDLMDEMLKCESKFVEDRIAHLCTALDIAVDDDFTPEEFCDLCTMLTNKMYEKRTGICVTH